jgi:hypothetical protein
LSWFNNQKVKEVVEHSTAFGQRDIRVWQWVNNSPMNATMLLTHLIGWLSPTPQMQKPSI